MNLRIGQLRTEWNREKNNYKTQEIGTGVQKFVKDVLKCKELFNLEEGKLSTPDELRKDEFLCEYKTKSAKKVDIAIFVTPEVLIPVEVEQYTNIKAGISQLFEYQVDLERKYGILTDGYSWRFYNNNIYREFTLKEIFDETPLFLEFWQDYIKPENYYLSFFEPIGQLSLFKDSEQLDVENNREMFFEDISKLIKSFKQKLKLEHYFNGLSRREKEKKATEITYAYVIQFILYKTLVDNEFKNFGDEYKNYLKKTHEHIKKGRYKDILSIIRNVSAKISKNIYRPFIQEQEYISHRFQQLYNKVENQLSDVSSWLDIFLFINKYGFGNVRNEIFGYVYENYLKELYEDEKRGQYFTDPAVVNFMLHQVGYTTHAIREKIRKNELDKLSIMDPACGSGTFLYSAVDQIIRAFGKGTKNVSEKIEEIVTQNVFGLDIAEFPLYLAEMNVLMRMLPLIMSEKYNNPVDKKIKVFLTNDSVAEFISSPIDNTRVDEHVRGWGGRQPLLTGLEMQEPEFESFMRVREDVKEMKESLRNNQIPRRRFDYVIGNPPYVGYNECSRQGIVIFKMLQGKVKPKVELKNIYGMNLHSIPNSHKKYAPKPNLYAFFIAVGLALLKYSGKLCYIIPQTVLTTADLNVLRYHLAEYLTIEKIIIFSSYLFISRGLKRKKVIPTSSLIFVVSKKSPTSKHQVEIINYEDGQDTLQDTLDNILKGRRIRKKKILQTELLKNVVNWNFIKQEQTFIDFYGEYKKNSEDIAIYYDHKRAESYFKNRFYFDGGGKINRKLISNDSKDAYEIFDYRNNDYSRLKVKKSNKFYAKNRKISFPYGSQGIVTFNQSYKIIWRTRYPMGFQFCDRDMLLEGNQSLTIASNNRREILYLLSLLNSRLIRTVLEGNLRQEQEQAFFVAITSIKEYIRVPKITKENRHVKDEIIRKTEELLALEEKTLSDFVDFSGILMQRFKEVRIEKNCLLLIDGNKITKLEIKNYPELVRNILNRELNSDQLKFKNKKVRLSYLRSLPIIDSERQKNLKDYIDVLVFVLYFNIPVKKVKFSEIEEIKRLCSRNKYFTMIAKYQR